MLPVMTLTAAAQGTDFDTLGTSLLEAPTRFCVEHGAGRLLQGFLLTCTNGIIVDVGNTDGALIKLLTAAQPGLPPLPAAEKRHIEPPCATCCLRHVSGVVQQQQLLCC